METQIACPSCNQTLAIDEVWAGHQVDCPLCQAPFIVPASNPAPMARVVSTPSPEGVAATPNSVSLWNPNAAINWSLFFSPVLGTYLHYQNWLSLGDTEQASKAKMWFIFAIVWTLGMPFIITLNSGGSGPAFWFGVVFLLAWYFGQAKKQVSYVKTQFGTSYERRGWILPMGIAFFSLFIVSLTIGIAVNVASVVLKKSSHMEAGVSKLAVELPPTVPVAKSKPIPQQPATIDTSVSTPKEAERAQQPIEPKAIPSEPVEKKIADHETKPSSPQVVAPPQISNAITFQEMLAFYKAEGNDAFTATQLQKDKWYYIGSFGRSGFRIAQVTNQFILAADISTDQPWALLVFEDQEALNSVRIDESLPASAVGRFVGFQNITMISGKEKRLAVFKCAGLNMTLNGFVNTEKATTQDLEIRQARIAKLEESMKPLQVDGKYAQTVDEHPITKSVLWDFRADNTVHRSEKWTDTIGKTYNRDNSGTYTVKGRTVTANLDQVILEYIFDIQENGDLNPSPNMTIKQSGILKKQSTESQSNTQTPTHVPATKSKTPEPSSNDSINKDSRTQVPNASGGPIGNTSAGVPGSDPALATGDTPPNGFWGLNDLFAGTPYADYSTGGKKFLIHLAQDTMKEEGIYDGITDGMPGSKTHVALIAYQRSKSLPLTGRFDAQLIEALNLSDLSDTPNWVFGKEMSNDSSTPPPTLPQAPPTGTPPADDPLKKGLKKLLEKGLEKGIQKINE